MLLGYFDDNLHFSPSRVFERQAPRQGVCWGIWSQARRLARRCRLDCTCNRGPLGVLTTMWGGGMGDVPSGLPLRGDLYGFALRCRFLSALNEGAPLGLALGLGHC